ncbi:unnamed protein product, partial [Brassica oleracea]
MGGPWSGPNSTWSVGPKTNSLHGHIVFIDDGFIDDGVCYRTMDFDTPNLIDEEDSFYLANEVHEDDPMPQESGSSERGISSSGSSRRRAKCWNNFTPGEKHSDGKTDVTCKYCQKYYCLNLRRNG